MTCACGGRVHDGTDKCRACWWKELSTRYDQFPDGLKSGYGWAMETVAGRLGAVAEGVLCGARCRVHDLAYVGSRPFEFIRTNGQLHGFPRCGGVRMGDDVEVFPFANVDAGFLGDTVIGRGTKIDHHVHVGHNAEIGEDVLLCAGTVVGGHVTIGDRAFVGINVSIKPRVRIGKEAVIGAGAVILHDVEDGAVVVGNPGHTIVQTHIPVDQP